MDRGDQDCCPGLSALEEHFPRIANKLCVLWGFSECEAFINNLMFDDRGGREGFPPQVAAELMLLMSLISYHDKRRDPWSSVPKAD